MGRTKKPCPGCGTTFAFPFRDDDKVCDSCQTKLREYDQKVGALPPAMTEMIVPISGGELPHLNDGTHLSCARPAMDAFRNAFAFLLCAVSEPAPLGRPRVECPRLLEDKSESYYSRGSLRRLNADVAKAAAALWVAVSPVLQESARIGCDSGSNLLAQLARNELTCDQFNKAQIKAKG